VGLLLLASPWIGASATAQERQYNLTGVTVYDAAEILGFAAQIAARREGGIDARAIADAIELIYREDGYFLAEVFVGSDGRTLVVDEGEIGRLTIEGVDAAMFARIRSYMAPVVGRRAITLAEFERAIMLVEDIQSITATAEIDYPPGSSAAEVRVLARPVDDAFGYVTLDHPSRALGEEVTLSFGEQFTSLLSPGDLLRIELSGTSDLEGDSSVSGALAYRFPLGGSGAYAEAYLGNVLARRDRDGALAPTDIEGNTAILALGYPVIRDVEAYGYALLEIRRSDSSVTVERDTGPDDAFDSGVQALAGSWISGRTLPEGGAWEYGLHLTWGERTDDPGGIDDGDDTFTHLRFGIGYDHPVDWFGPESSVRAELWGQYSNDRLPGIEQFHIGGRDEDRGYLFTEAQGDSGISATLEVGRDLFPASGALRRYQPFGFFDAGWVGNNAPSRTGYTEETFASLGLGVDIELARGVFVRTYAAVPMLDGPSTGAGDPAFYLGLTKSW
jgi:hemolysin activation/secretion protein